MSAPLLPRTAKCQPIRIVDVFSGAGGLALGWLRAAEGRGEFVAAIDGDGTLERIYGQNYPTTKFIQHTFAAAPDPDGERRLAEEAGLGAGDVDVLLAGPPCQTLSAAGKRQDHPDNRLVFRVCDLVRTLRPRVVVIENVPQFGHIHDGRLLGRVRVQLTKAGYTTDALALNATAYGVPQIRVRCFVIGVRRELLSESPHAQLKHLRPPPTHSAVWSPNRPTGQPASPILGHALRLPPSVEDALDDLPPLAVGEGDEEGLLTVEPTNPYQAFLRRGQQAVFNHVATKHSPETVAALAAIKPGETPQSIPGHPLRRKVYFRSAYARLDPRWVAPTMTTQTHNPGSGRFTHYRDDRVLTVREVARLQSFPDSFRFFGFSEVQRRHVGNAVPPLLSEALARSLMLVIHA